MLDVITPVHVHVHHSIGLPEVLFDLLAARNVPYDWTIHDYYSICPRINLIGSTGRYCGEPDTAACTRCLAELGDDRAAPSPDSIVDSAREAHAGWRELGESSRRASMSCAVSRVTFRTATCCCGRTPSRFPAGSLARPFEPARSVRVAVIGTLVAVKGSERLLACARDARTRGCPSNFTSSARPTATPSCARQGNVHVTGPLPGT